MPNLRKWVLEDGTELDIISKTDKTLSRESIPGDSKVIGDKFSTLEEKINDIDLKKEVINRPTHFDFPSIGSVDYIYKAYKEKKTYQWNAEELKYELLNEVPQIKLINGGNANGSE